MLLVAHSDRSRQAHFGEEGKSCPISYLPFLAMHIPARGIGKREVAGAYWYGCSVDGSIVKVMSNRNSCSGKQKPRHLSRAPPVDSPFYVWCSALRTEYAVVLWNLSRRSTLRVVVGGGIDERHLKISRSEGNSTEGQL